MRSSGLEINEIHETRVAAVLRVGPTQQTPFGLTHGGVYATAVESTASAGACLAVAHENKHAVGLCNTTNFLRPFAEGELTVTAHAVFQGATQQLWSVDIRNDQDKLVARGELRLQNVDLNVAGRERPTSEKA